MPLTWKEIDAERARLDAERVRLNAQRERNKQFEIDSAKEMRKILIMFLIIALVGGFFHLVVWRDGAS